jgi:hypothetical protein
MADVKTWEDRISAEWREHWAKQGYNPTEAAVMGEISELRAALQAQQGDAPAVRESVRDAVAAGLVGNFYCGRVWSAWGVGTMREDDFTPSEEVDDVVDEITDAAIAAMLAARREG